MQINSMNILLTNLHKKKDLLMWVKNIHKIFFFLNWTPIQQRWAHNNMMKNIYIYIINEWKLKAFYWFILFNISWEPYAILYEQNNTQNLLKRLVPFNRSTNFYFNFKNLLIGARKSKHNEKKHEAFEIIFPLFNLRLFKVLFFKIWYFTFHHGH